MTTTNSYLAENPLTEFPLGGGLVELLDKLLADIGFSARWAETVEFLVLGIALFLLLQVTVGRLAPWLSTKLAGRANLLTAPVPALLLAPEWLVTKLMVRSGRAPGNVVYSYGESVFVLADSLEAIVNALLRALGHARKGRRVTACVLLVLGFLWWNNGACVGESSPCVSPVEHWTQLG